MEQPRIAVICSCGYDGKLTSPLCPLHGEHGLSAQVDRLRAVNAKLLEALEGLVDDVMDAGTCHTCSNFAEEDGHEPDCHIPVAREAIEEARK